MPGLDPIGATVINDQCPKCGNKLQGWHELSADEREVVKRLPGAMEYKPEERQSQHRWCTRCWHEETGAERRA